MTEYEYNALQEALSNRLKKMKSHHEFRGSTNYQDGFKDGLLAAKSVLSQEYKWHQKDEGWRGMKKVTMTKELALELLDIRIMGIMNNLSEWEALGDVMPDDMREELETNLSLYRLAYDAISGSTPDADTEV